MKLPIFHRAEYKGPITMIIILLSVSIMASSQPISKVRLPKGVISYGAVFDSIHRQLHLAIEYGHVKLDPKKQQILIYDSLLSLDQVLYQCLHPLGMTYLYQEYTIFLRYKSVVK